MKAEDIYVVHSPGEGTDGREFRLVREVDFPSTPPNKPPTKMWLTVDVITGDQMHWSLDKFGDGKLLTKKK